jgi:hypothetical protein
MAKVLMALLVFFMLASMVGSMLSGSGGIVSSPLSVPVTATDVTINVVSTDGFAPSGYIDLQNEKITYASKDSTKFLACTRGVEGTIASAHPLISQGLRVKVYAEDAGALNRAFGFDVGAVAASSGIMGTPMVAFYFFTKTLPHILAWDCLSFLTGQLAIIRIILIIVTAVIIIILAIQLGMVLSNALQKILPG